MKKLFTAIYLVIYLVNIKAQTLCNQNLIINGDFELGNSYFSSDYSYDALSSLSQNYNTTIGLPYTPSPYGKHYNVYNIKSNFYDQDTCSDHTTFVNINPITPPDFIPYSQRGNGKALALRAENETLNYPSNTASDVWYQYVNLKANTNYNFRAYYCSPAAGFPAYPFNNLVFQLYVNGVKIGETSYARYTDPYMTWSKASFTFNSGINSINTKISIKAFYADPSGGSYTATATPDTDQLFFIDDISLTGCLADEGIIGYVYNDLNINCIKDAGDIGIQNILVKLYDNTNTVIAQTNTSNNGLYTFVKPVGTYTVVIDTMGTSYKTLCPYPGVDTLLSIVNGLAQQDVNFPLVCKSSFDIGVKSINQIGSFIKSTAFITNRTYLIPDIGYINNSGCTSAFGGQVVIQFSGPISYLSGPFYISSPAQLTPTVFGNTLTYTVADFSSLTNESFLFAVTTSSLALPGSTACFSITVTPTLGDYNPTNNVMQQCYNIMSQTPVQGITGSVYRDVNLNCKFDSGDLPLAYVPVKLYDSGNVMIDQTSTANTGSYFFVKPTGAYTVVVDTLNKPFKSICPFPGVDTLVNVVGILETDSVNFPLTCKPGFDIGVRCFQPQGSFTPGQSTKIFLTIEDVANWSNLVCNTNTSGQVIVTLSGPITFSTPASGALTPTIVGNTLTYNVANFSQINWNDFGFYISTNTTAVIGNSVCISVNVTPTIGDINLSNNYIQSCWTVGASYDPNYKEVYPIDVQPGFNDWLTYTIHFQNTGNAPAYNIRLADTLDAMLDLETFQVMSSSHLNTSHVNGSVLTVNYQNIMLPDSTSDYYGSQGYIQYRVKPKATWVSPYQIKNTAYIYFDYNTPVVTNTTYNSILLTTGINKYNESSVNIYPNPTDGVFNIELNIKEKQTLEVFNITGDLLYSQIIENGKAIIDASHLSSGVYNLSIKGNECRINKKMIILK